MTDSAAAPAPAPRPPGAACLPAGAGAARDPVLHVGLHQRHQQHVAAASAQRVRAQLSPDDLIESTWFIGYLLASIPAAKLIERIGYQRALVVGLTVMTVGSLGMILAASLPSYWVTLASLFTVSCGIALLQVAANPYVAVIGPPATSESRLTLVQAFNTTGDVLAIVFGRYLILAPDDRRAPRPRAPSSRQAQRMADAQATELPYLIVAIVLAVLAVAIARARLPALGGATQRASAEARKGLSLWSHRNLMLGCGAICLCVLSEIGVGNLFINFASQPSGRQHHPRAGRLLPHLRLGRDDGRPLRRRVDHALRRGRKGAGGVRAAGASPARWSRPSCPARPRCTG